MVARVWIGLDLTLHCRVCRCVHACMRQGYLALPRHGSGRGIAAPRSVARQALPSQRLAIPVAATSALCRATMHGTTQAFGRARAIGASKSVSLKKSRVLDLKLVFKNVKIKKKSQLVAGLPLRMTHLCMHTAFQIHYVPNVSVTK